MDFSQNLVLKEDYAFAVADRDGRIEGGEHGVYLHDTRLLSRYAWRFGDDVETLLAFTPRPDRLESHHSAIDGPAQRIGVHRRARIGAADLDDRVKIRNTGRRTESLELRLAVDADFADIFEVRGYRSRARPTIEADRGDGGATFRYRADDGLDAGVDLALAPAPDRWDGATAVWDVRLAPGESLELEATIGLHSGALPAVPGPDYETWRRGFASLPAPPELERAAAQAVDDLRALLLFTPQGPVPAAGIPWYVAAFGRDALLTALLTLPDAPEMAAGTVRYLAAHAGRERDQRTTEAPGKILHELRHGELTRTGDTPYGPYYGSVDATPLWIVLLHRVWRASGDLDLVRSHRDALEAALAWMSTDGDPDGDGFLEFEASSPAGVDDSDGITVQSWKDSRDSLSHADGRLAAGSIAVNEVQGYAFDAYRSAAELFAALGDAGASARWSARAEALQAAFHDAFWLDDLGTYALALDHDKAPLRVHNSDAGHLLWSGIVPEAVAPRLAATLLEPANFSGWGLRTLGADEARYNPVSYHNGSVWPHDTALVALGLARYGLDEAADRLARSVLDLATSQADHRPPELVSGHQRAPGAPPVPYPTACRPQAWDAAAVVAMLRLRARLAAAGG